jgi:hypothetical protein
MLHAALGGALLLGLSAAPAHAIPIHKHGVGWTSAESDGDVGVLESHNHSGVASEAGNSPHQHYNGDLDVGGWNDTQGDTWSTFGAWDDETFYLDTSDPFDGPYAPVWHGFISELAPNTIDDRTMMGKDDHIPDYFFKGVWDNDAKGEVGDAFDAWSALAAGVSPTTNKLLITGLEFEETLVEANAEILLLWPDIAQLGLTNWANVGANTEGDVTVSFDSSPGMGGWHFGSEATTPDDEFHFLSTALHEVGHVVGLDEQDDDDDVMIRARDAGKNDPGAGKGPAFDALDVDSKTAGYALYSIAVPEPSALSLLGAGLLGIGLLGRAGRGERSETDPHA